MMQLTFKPFQSVFFGVVLLSAILQRSPGLFLILIPMLKNQEEIAILNQQVIKKNSQLDILNNQLQNTQVQINEFTVTIKELENQKTIFSTIINELTTTVKKLEKKQAAAGTVLQQVQKNFTAFRLYEAENKEQINTTKNQKSTNVAPVIPFYKPITRVYIDGNNLKHAADELKLKIDYKALLTQLSKPNQVTEVKYYRGSRNPKNAVEDKESSVLTKSGYEVVTLPVLPRENGTFKTQGDDVKIALDIKNEVKPDDLVILVSGDGDFVPIVDEIKKLRGVKVIVVSKASMLNTELKKRANQVILLDDLVEQIAYSRHLTVI